MNSVIRQSVLYQEVGQNGIGERFQPGLCNGITVPDCGSGFNNTFGLIWLKLWSDESIQCKVHNQVFDEPSIESLTQQLIRVNHDPQPVGLASFL